MEAEILNSLVSCIRAANEWFLNVLNASGMSTIVVGFITIAICARFILQPIIGGRFFSAASDRIKRSSIGEKNKEGD